MTKLEFTDKNGTLVSYEATEVVLPGIERLQPTPGQSFSPHEMLKRQNLVVCISNDSELANWQYFHDWVISGELATVTISIMGENGKTVKRIFHMASAVSVNPVSVYEDMETELVVNFMFHDISIVVE